MRRRDLLQMAPLSLLAGLGIPRLARAGVSANDRKFLFVFASGGWDPTWVFAPEFDNPFVDMPPDDSQKVQQGGHTWVSSASRPSVDSFFTTFGHRTCMVNGLVVPSIAHERCRRLLFTGGSSADTNDFPMRLAMGAPGHLPLANVVFSGPSYADGTGSGAVRIGTNGQFGALLDGSCVAGSLPPLRLPNAAIGALEDSYVLDRVQRAAAAAQRGAASRIAGAYASAVADATGVAAMSDLLTVGAADSRNQLLDAADLLASGVARCVTVADVGVEGVDWDTHSEITRQALNYESLFGNLNVLLAFLESSAGTTGGSLADEVTVVVFSEMGRYPRFNVSMGKDHWTTTSMMLIGGGIQGGRLIGGYDDNMGGVPVIPSTGESDPTGASGGVVLQSVHLGATLLALADMDPVEAFGSDVEPLTGVLQP